MSEISVISDAPAVTEISLVGTTALCGITTENEADLYQKYNISISAYNTTSSWHV